MRGERNVVTHGAVEIAGRERVGLHHLGRGALEDHLATLATGTRTDVDDVVGMEHHVAVVLDDNDGIAQVAQLLQRTDEAVVVALVQSDGGLVEDVEHIDEL